MGAPARSRIGCPTCAAGVAMTIDLISLSTSSASALFVHRCFISHFMTPHVYTYFPPFFTDPIRSLLICFICSPALAAGASGRQNLPCRMVRANPRPRLNAGKRRMWKLRLLIHRFAVTSTFAPGMSADSIALPGLITKASPHVGIMPLPEGIYSLSLQTKFSHRSNWILTSLFPNIKVIIYVIHPPSGYRS